MKNAFKKYNKNGNMTRWGMRGVKHNHHLAVDEFVAIFKK